MEKSERRLEINRILKHKAWSPYVILGLDPTAQPADVKKKYKTLSLLVHPDRNDEEDKLDATEAFQVLSNACERLVEGKAAHWFEDLLRKTEEDDRKREREEREREEKERKEEREKEQRERREKREKQEKARKEEKQKRRKECVKGLIGLAIVALLVVASCKIIVAACLDIHSVPSVLNDMFNTLVSFPRVFLPFLLLALRDLFELLLGIPYFVVMSILIDIANLIKYIVSLLIKFIVSPLLNPNLYAGMFEFLFWLVSCPYMLLDSLGIVLPRKICNWMLRAVHPLQRYY